MCAQRNFFVTALMVILFVTAANLMATESWRGAWYINTPDEVILGADQSYFCFDAKIQPNPQRIALARLIEVQPSDSIRIIFFNDQPIFFEGSVGLDGYTGYFRVWFPEGLFEPGNHIFKAKISDSGKSLKMGFTTTVNLPKVGQPCPIFITEVSVKKNGGDWQPIDNFVCPDTPYADGDQLSPVTGNFVEALGEVHGYSRAGGTETRVFYSLRRGYDLKPGDTVVLVSHINSGNGIVQYAEGGDYPLELAVTWSGNFNWADLSDLRAYKITSAPTHVTDRNTTPTDFALGQNYPNPFNPATTIPFSLHKPAEITLAVYNLRGEIVRHLVPPGTLQPAGQHHTRWDGLDASGNPMPSGTYLVRLSSTNGQVDTKKMVLTK